MKNESKVVKGKAYYGHMVHHEEVLPGTIIKSVPDDRSYEKQNLADSHATNFAGKSLRNRHKKKK